MVPTMGVRGQGRHAVPLQPGPEGTDRVLALVVEQQADRQRHLPRVAARSGSRHAGRDDPCTRAAWLGGEVAVVQGVGLVLLADAVGPGRDAGGGHGQGPAAVVLEAVVAPAEGDQVRWGGVAAGGEGGDVVDVAAVGGGGAAGEAAGAVAAADEPGGRLAGPVDPGVDGEQGAGVGVVQDGPEPGVGVGQQPGQRLGRDQPDPGRLDPDPRQLQHHTPRPATTGAPAAGAPGTAPDTRRGRTSTAGAGVGGAPARDRR